jgi:hypothetical protein
MWLGDTCHTYDRHNIQAQLECGIGMNNGVLENLSKLNFIYKYFPFVQSKQNKDCIESFVHDSYLNMFFEMARYLQVGVSVLVLAAVNNI